MRDKVVTIRLNEKEYALLLAEAERLGVSLSEVLRDYVKTLGKKEKR